MTTLTLDLNGQTVTLPDGTVFTTTYLTGSNNVTNNSSSADGTLIEGGGSNGNTYSGDISDGTNGFTTAITQTSGFVEFTNANTYSGGTNLQGGTIGLGNSNALGTGALTMSDGTTLRADASALTLGNSVTLNGSDTIDTNGFVLTLSGVISGTGSLTILSEDTLTLSNANTYSGGTILQTFASTIVVGNNTALGTGTLSMGSQTTLQAGASGLTLANSVTLGGFDTLDTNGNALTLSGVISGTSSLTKIGSGTLILTNTNTYSGTTTLRTGTLTVGNSSALGTGTLNMRSGTTLRAGAPGLTLANSMILGGTETLDTNGNALTLSGVVSDSGTGSLTKIGAGTLTLSNANTYSGGTILQNGMLAVGNNASLGTGTLTIDDGTTLQAGASGLTLANGVTLAGSDTLDTNSNSLTLSGVISGTGSLTEIGAGTLILTNTNTYSGATTINVGTLALSSGGSISSSSGVTANGTFDITGVTSGTTISSLAGSGAVELGGNNLVITAGSTEFSGVIGGSGGLEISGGTQTLSGVNTYTNVTQIDPGATLALKGNGSIGYSLYVAFLPFSTSTFDISQTNAGASVAGLYDPNGVGIVSLGSKTLTITNNVGPFNGVVADGGIGGGTGGNLTIANGGLASLGGTNTYTGLTTINADGELDLIGNGGSQNGSIASSSGVVNNGIFDISAATSLVFITTLSGSGLVALGSQILELTNASSTFSGVIGGSGGQLFVTGGTETLTGANTYTGGTIVENATLAVGNNAALGTGQLIMAPNSTLQFVQNRLNLLNAIGLSNLAGTFDTGANTVTLSGAISGDADLTKIGSGTLILTAADTYSGGTNVDAGTLELGSDGSISGNVTFAGAAGTLRLDTGTNQIAGDLNGALVGDDVDLRFLSFASGDHAVWQQTNGGSGTLSVVDGSGHTLASLDLVGQYETSNFTTISDGANNGTLIEVVAPPTSPLTYANDFAGSGIGDILWTSGNQLGVWVENSSLNPTWELLSPNTNGWSVVGTGDYNGDRINDILWQNGNQLGVWTESSNLNPTWTLLSSNTAGWSVVGGGDYTGSGTDDILFQNGNQLGVWLMNNSLTPTWDLLSSNTGGWSVVGSGDYNGDGISDILWQNGNQVGVWTESSNLTPTWHLLSSNTNGYPWSAAATTRAAGSATSYFKTAISSASGLRTAA